MQKILMKGFLIHTDIKVRTLGEKVYARAEYVQKSQKSKCKLHQNAKMIVLNSHPLKLIISDLPAFVLCLGGKGKAWSLAGF